MTSLWYHLKLRHDDDQMYSLGRVFLNKAKWISSFWGKLFYKSQIKIETNMIYIYLKQSKQWFLTCFFVQLVVPVESIRIVEVKILTCMVFEDDINL